MRFRGLLTLLCGLILAVGCTYDSDIDTSGFGSEGDGVTTVNIRATLPEFGGVTRGVNSAKGGTTNIDWEEYSLRVIIKAYGDESEPEKYRGKEAASEVRYFDGTSDGRVDINLDMPLTSDHTYDIYMWADYVEKGSEEDLHYDTAEFPAIALKHDVPVINDESLDAFYGKAEITVGDGYYLWDEGSQFPISRAVAKLRMVATDANSASATSATLQMDTFYGGFNIATAEAINKATGAVVSDKTAFETYSTESAPDTKSFITAYMLWPASADASIVANFYEEGKEDAVSEIAPTNAIPLKRGNLTTLRGEMFESGWDGTTLVEPMTIDGDWLVLNNAKELAWVLETRNTKEKNKIRITSDMDMGGHAVNPFPVNVSDFDGNNKSITNIVVDGNSLFTIDKALSIHDLNVDTITVGDAETVGHVGVLLDEVKLADGDNITYSNVSITNATVSTTDGAAGGLIGYIGRADEKNRDVKYTVTIENCELTDVTAAGSLSEGHLVGLFSGYDSGETLIFKDNNTIANANTRVIDYVSHYTSAQQSCWLAAVDAKYDGMLGNEVYHRGTVHFGDQLFVPKWDGETKVEPLTEDGALAIYSAFDMAKLPDIEATSVKMMADVDMGNGSIATLKNSITAFDGNNKSIHNIAINGNALLAKSDVAVQKLTIDGATIGTETTTGNVGVLFSEIRATGTVSISDITVRNATLKTTNGCAGGIVGYVGRTTENARNTSLTATFTRCHGTNITSDTAQHVGQLVGQFGGYDSNETLTFSECTSTPAAGYTSIYRADQQSCWRTAIGATTFDGILGAEKFYRGTIMFGDKQFSPKWDGKTKVVPLTESGAYLIYSPFDLANLQQTVVRSGEYPHKYTWSNRTNHNSVIFKSDVDLGGVCDDCRSKGCICTKAGKGTCDCTECRKFTPIYSIKTLEGNNHTVYNLHVDMIHDGNHGAGFMQTTVSGSNHRNLNLVGANIKTDHDRNIPICAYGQDDNGSGNAYGGTFVAATGSGTYTINNIKVSSGKVSGVCKIGGLIGRATCATLNMTNCSVDNYIVENYEANRPNYYPIVMDGSMTVTCLGWWYTQGECGGLIGFVKCSSTANIEGCSVTNTKMNCYGQEDNTVTANLISGSYSSMSPTTKDSTAARGTTLIAGRHVNQFIGDVVSDRTSDSNTSTYVVNIKDYTVSGNSYRNGVSANSTNDYNHCYAKTNTGSWWRPNYVYDYCEVVGSTYYVGVEIDIAIYQKHVRYYAGTLTFNKKGESSTTLTETANEANGIKWTGGNFSVAGLGGSTSYPPAPTNIGD